MNRYPVKCSECDHEFYAAKSILQESGMFSAGHGSCPSCKTFLNLEFIPHLEIMKSQSWEAYVKQLEEAKQ